MRQNAGPIHAFAGFKRLISVIKYQELMPDPFDSLQWDRAFDSAEGSRSALSPAPTNRFNGTAHLIARKDRARLSLRLRRTASMGPRI